MSKSKGGNLTIIDDLDQPSPAKPVPSDVERGLNSSLKNTDSVGSHSWHSSGSQTHSGGSQKSFGSSVHNAPSKKVAGECLVDNISSDEEGSGTKIVATFSGVEAGIVLHFFEDDLKKIDSDYGGLTSRQPSMGQAERVDVKCKSTKDTALIESCVENLNRQISLDFSKESVAFGHYQNVAENFIKENGRNSKVLFYLNEKEKQVEIVGQVYEDVKSGKHQLNVHLGFTKPTGARSRSYANAVSNTNTNSSGGTRLYPDLSKETGKSSSFSSSGRSGEFDINIELQGGVFFRVYKASIVRVKVDAIVNAANDGLMHGGGVALAIANAAGYQLTKESKDYIDRYQRVEITENCITSAGRLPYKGVIHAVGPQWYQYRDKRKCLQAVYDTVWKIFETCKRKRYSSVAIPAISAGIYGVPKKLCADMYVKAAVDLSKMGWDNPRELHFVDVDEEILRLINKSYKSWNEDPQSIDLHVTVSEYLQRNPSNESSSESWVMVPGKGRSRGRRGHRDFSASDGGNNNEWKTNKPGRSTVVDNPRGNNHNCKVIVGPNVQIGHGIIADTYKINDLVTVKIYDGLIDKVSKVDAVVSAVDVSFKPSGLIASSLEKAGGKSYEKAVKNMQTDIFSEKKKYGEVAVSEGGNLKVQKVIHLVSIRASSLDNLSMFKRGMTNVFTEADTNMFTSIALPLLGTGGLKGTKEGLLGIFCDAFVETMCEFYATNPQPKLTEIHLVNRSDVVCRALNKAFQKVYSSRGVESGMKNRPLPALPSSEEPMETDDNDPLYQTIPADDKHRNSGQDSGNKAREMNYREQQRETSSDDNEDQASSKPTPVGDTMSKTASDGKSKQGNLLIFD